MLIVVTGGCGFIGSQVVAVLARAGHRVRVLDLLDTLPPVARGDGVELVTGDVRDGATCDRVMVGADAVVHLAAVVGMGVDLQDLPRYASHNDLGTAVLLAAMARSGVHRLVLSSSMVVYGEGAYRCENDGCDAHGPVGPGPRTEQALAAGRFEPPCPGCGQPLAPALVPESAALDPRSVYAATKVAQEHLVAVWARSLGVEAVALRYHNVYGPGMPRDTPYAGVAAIFRSALRAGQAPQVFEDGGQRRDFVHVTDVARANLAALERVCEPPAVSGLLAVNIASGTVRTIGEVATQMWRACGGPAPQTTGRFRLGDVRHVTADPALAADALGWRAEMPFEDGIAELAAEGTDAT